MAEDVKQLEQYLKRISSEADKVSANLKEMQAAFEQALAAGVRGAKLTEDQLKRLAQQFVSGAKVLKPRAYLGMGEEGGVGRLTSTRKQIEALDVMIKKLRELIQERQKLNDIIAKGKLGKIDVAQTDYTDEGLRKSTISTRERRLASVQASLQAETAGMAEFLRPQMIQQVNAAMKEFSEITGKTFDRVTIAGPKELASGFKQFDISLKAGTESAQKFKLVLTDTNKLLRQAELRAQTAGRGMARAPITPADIQRQLTAIQMQSVERYMQRQGFGMGDIQNVRTQFPSQISTVRFKQAVAGQEGVFRTLEVNVDRFGRVIDKTNKRFLGFTESIIRNTQELLRWSFGIALIYGSMYRIQELMRLAIDNQEKLAEITVVLGRAQRDVNEIFQDAAKVANETGESINDVLETYAYAYRAVGGVAEPIERTAAANKLLADATLLNKISSLDAAEAIDVLAGSLRQLPKVGQDMSKALNESVNLLDRWTVVSNNANIDLGTLATAFSITAESALNAGTSVEELNAIIAILAEKIGGLGGRETGNAVRALIGGVYQGQAASALQQYGITVEDTEGRMRDFLDISNEIFQLYQRGVIDDTEINKLGYTLGGGVRRGQQYVAFLTDMNRIQELVAIQTQAHGAAQEALARRVATTQTNITKLSNAFQSLAQTLGGAGGALDTGNSFLELLTSLVNMLESLTEHLQGLTIPLALTGLLTAMATLGTGAAGRRLQMGAFVGGLLEAPFTQAARVVGFAQGRRVSPQMEAIQGLGIRAGNWGLQQGPGLLAGGIIAGQRALQGNWGAAGADIAGAFIGAVVAGPIGAVVGAALADTFITQVLQYDFEFEQLFAGMKDPLEKAMEDSTQKGMSKGIEKEDIFKTIARDYGGGLLSLRADAWFLQQITRGGELLGKGEALTREQAALVAVKLQGGDMERIAELINRRRAETPVTFQPQFIEATDIDQRRAEIEKGFADLLDDLSQQTQDQLREQLYAQEIKSGAFLGGTLEAQAFEIVIPKWISAFGDALIRGREDINDTEEAIIDMRDVLVDSTDEEVKYLEQLIDEYIELEATIEQAKLTPGVKFIEYDEEILPIKEAKEQAQEMQDTIVNLYNGLRIALKQRKVELPDLITLEVDPKYFELIREEAIRLQEAYLAALTPDERQKEEATIAQANALIEIFGEAGEIAYRRVRGGPLDRFWTTGLERLREQDVIPEPGRGIGFQTFPDFTIAEFQRLLGAPYENLLARLTGLGYEPDKTEQIAILQDGIVKPEKKDWKIVQLLLQDILDTEKKQLEGIYNLPTDASFYVPFQGYRLGFGQGGGGILSQLPELTAAGKELKAAAGDLRLPFMEDLGAEKEAILGRRRAERPTREETAFQESINQMLAVLQEFGAIQRDELFRESPEVGLAERIELLALTQQRRFEEQRRESPELRFAEGFEGIKTPLDNLVRMLTTQEQIGPFQNLLPLANLQEIFAQPQQQPRLETNLSIEFDTTTTLQVDGRTLATIVKQYLFSDLITYQDNITNSIL